MKTPREFGPGALCRLDEHIIHAIVSGNRSKELLTACCLVIVVGSALYGAAFGIWRAPSQALSSAIKMPLLILSVVVLSGMVNGMLAQVSGARLGFRQIFLSILLSFAIASAILGAVSPAAAYLALQFPPPGSSADMRSYRLLLPAHTAMIGLAGLVGTLRLYRLLVRLTQSKGLSMRVLCWWVVVSGLTGAELSWVFSPYLARPDIAIPFLNPNAFTSNFFEYLWQTMLGKS